jgi:hypothetical protein
MGCEAETGISAKTEQSGPSLAYGIQVKKQMPQPWRVQEIEAVGDEARNSIISINSITSIS